MLLLLATNTSSQTLSGRVLHNATLKAITGALISVHLKDTIYNANSDSLGRFKLVSIPMGRASVTVSLAGYRAWESSEVVLLAGRDVYLEVRMTETETAIGEVSITARNIRFAQAGARQINSELANRYAGTWGDAARAVANTAGVFSAGDMRNDIIVRGNSPAGVVWRIDGFELINPNHFGSLGGSGGPVSVVNSNLLANSTFYTGGFPAEFGNVTSGLFDLQMRCGNAQRHEFIVGIGFNGLEGGAEGPLTKSRSGASYLVNARYAFLEILRAMRIIKSTSGIPKYHDATAKINIPLKRGYLSLLAIWGWSSLASLQEQQKESDYESGIQVYNTNINNNNKLLFTGLNYTHHLNGNLRLENRLSYQIFSRQVELTLSGYPHDTVIMAYNGHEREDKITFKSTAHYIINHRNTLRAGLGGTMYRVKLHNALEGQPALERSLALTGLLHAFALWKIHFNELFLLNVGCYGHCFTLNGDYSVEPRATARWTPLRGTTISLAGGMHSQLLPQPIYFYRQGNSLPNHSLPAAKSWQAVLSLSQDILNALNARLELYYIAHYRVPVPLDIPQESFLNTGDEYHNAWDCVFVSEGKGKNYGVELTLDFPFQRSFYLSLTGTYYRAVYMGRDCIWRSGKYARDFGLTAVGGYEWRIGQHTLLGLNIRCACIGGRRYTPSQTLRSGKQHVEYSKTYSERYPNYFRLDCNLAVKQSFNAWSIEWYFEVTNATNRKNISKIFYDEAYGKQRRIYESSIMPIGGMRVYF